MSLDVATVKKEFPILAREIDGANTDESVQEAEAQQRPTGERDQGDGGNGLGRAAQREDEDVSENVGHKHRGDLLHVQVATADSVQSHSEVLADGHEKKANQKNSGDRHGAVVRAAPDHREKSVRGQTRDGHQR